MTDSPSPGPTPNPEAIVERLQGLLGWESVSDDYVRLRIDVLRAQSGVLAELEGSVGPAENKLPLEPEDLPLDAGLAQRLFDSVAQACRRYGNPAPELADLRSAVATEPELLERLIRRAMLPPVQQQLGSPGAPLPAPAELVAFAGRLVAAPFVTAAVGKVRRHRSASPQSSGSCPICGSPPGLASLRPDDRARVLHCSLCAAEWRFTRLDCPFCAAEVSCSLVRLTIAGEEARWVEACDRCRHYLKVVDRRQQPLSPGGQFIPLGEEVGGLGLDLVAEKEGYLRGPVYAALG